MPVTLIQYKFNMNLESQPTPELIVNKGTGAGGANTNLNGKKFEDKTNNIPRLFENGYEKIILNKKTKTFEDKKIIFVSQSGLKDYIKHKYNIQLFRCPDEAYIIEYNTGKKVIKILEKKEQTVEGSVDTKLMAGPLFKEEYEEALEFNFDIEYVFCVSKFLQDKIMSSDKKYIIFNKLMKKHNIAILFGDDETYFERVDEWISNSL